MGLGFFALSSFIVSHFSYFPLRIYAQKIVSCQQQQNWWQQRWRLPENHPLTSRTLSKNLGGDFTKIGDTKMLPRRRPSQSIRSNYTKHKVHILPHSLSQSLRRCGDDDDGGEVKAILCSSGASGRDEKDEEQKRMLARKKHRKWRAWK